MSWLSYALILRPRVTRSIFVGVIAFSLGAAGTAAAVRGFVASDNMFHACANSIGNVRVLTDGDTCKNGEVGFMFPSQAYVDAETEARRLSETALQSSVDGSAAALAAEAAARQAADSALQGNDVTLQTNLDNETAARKQGDADTLAAGKSYTDGAVGNEAAARTAADNGLQTNLDAETAARKAADATLQAAGATLQSNIDAEAAARAAADAAEMAARTSGDAATLAAANAYTDAHAGGRPALQIVTTRVSNPAQLDPGGTLTASVSCSGGKVVIGGGASSSNSNVVLYQSSPTSLVQWTVSARALATIAPFGEGLTVYAICMG